MWAFILTVCLLSVLAGLRTPAPRDRSIILRVRLSSFGAGRPPTCQVVLSNCCDDPVRFRCGDLGPEYVVRCLNVEVWEDLATLYPYKDGHLLPPHWYNEASLSPHSVRTDQFALPSYATAIELGLPYVRCSWKGKLASRIAEGRLNNALGTAIRPLCRALFRSDEVKRSGTEWSGVIRISNGDSAASASK